MPPGRSLGKNHLAEHPLTSERMRSPTRSLARAVFIKVGEEHMPCLQEILGRDLWAQKVSQQQQGTLSPPGFPIDILTWKSPTRRSSTSLAVVSSVTQATEDGIVLSHLFAELPLTPKMNGHQQATAKPDLESLLPATAEPPKYAMNHGGRKKLPLSHSV